MSTIKDVARRTGLSLSTISKYLNGGNVREENRIAIEQAIRELDYSVNYFARGLKSRRSHIIGVLIPTISSPFFGNVVAAMEPVFRENGYDCIVCSYNFDPAMELEKLEFLNRRQVDGVIYVPGSATAKQVRSCLGDLPVVIIDRILEDCDYDTVVVDNLNAVYMALEHLIARGHRRIGLIVGPQEISTARERATGYRRVLSDYSIQVDENLIAEGQYDMASGAGLFKKLLALPDPPTAILVTSYDLTIGAITAAHECGVNLPQDLDLIGFDNINLCSILSPRLEIVEQPMADMGRTAAQCVMARLQGDTSPKKLLRLKAQLSK